MIVRDVYEDVREVIGKNDQTVIFDRITKAVELLANTSGGGWDALVGQMEVLVTDGRVVTLPRDVEVPLMVNQNGRPSYFRNKWFEFHYNGPGSDRQDWNTLKVGPRPGDVTCDFLGRRFPIIRDLASNGGTLLYTVDNREDLAKTCTAYGFDSQGKWVRSQLPDGTYQDGYLVPVRRESGSPTEITTVDRIRDFTGGSTDYLISTTAHQYVTGEPVILSLVTPPLPTGLTNSSLYYARRIDDNRLSLHPTRADAVNNTNVAVITSASTSSVLQLADYRTMKVQTQFTCAVHHNMLTSDPVTFSAITLPGGITAGTTYYINRRDQYNYTIHTNTVDAEAGTNAVNVSTPGDTVYSSSRQATNPNTILTFSVNHNLVQGDAITVSNSGGALPQPLIPNTIYYVRYIDATSITLHNLPADASTGENPILLTTTGSGTSSIVKTILAQAIVGDTSNIRAQSHNLSNGDLIQFTTTGTMPNAKVWEVPSTLGVAVNTSADTFTPNDGNPYPDDTPVVFSGTSAPGGISFGTTYYVVSGTSTNFKVAATVAGSAIDITSTGTAVYVQKVTGYADEAPLVIGTIYKAVTPIGSDTFTLADVTYSHVIDITTAGSGQLTLVISRAFLVGYKQSFDFENADKLETGVTIMVGTDGALPTASPALNVATVYYARVLSSTAVELYDTYAHSVDVPNTTGRITISSLGTGQMYLVIKRLVEPTVFNNDLIASSNAFLQDGATVRLVTNGTLPSPLLVDTDYYLEIGAGNVIRLRDHTTEDLITLNDIGSGTHKFTIIQNFGVDLPTYFNVVNQPYSTGDAVEVQSTGTPPSPLVAGTTYYVRALTDTNTIELYDTQAHAEDTASTTGRVLATNSGSGAQTLVDEMPNIVWSKIDRILRDSTNGFGHLYCFDGLSPDAVGFYYPDETEPLYNRILLGLASRYPTQTADNPTNVRLMYRRKTYVISGMDDYIPLRNGLAIALAARAIDLFKTNHLDEGNDHMKQAMKFLEDKQQDDEGPNVIGLQILDNTWTGPQETWMM